MSTREVVRKRDGERKKREGRSGRVKEGASLEFFA